MYQTMLGQWHLFTAVVWAFLQIYAANSVSVGQMVRRSDRNEEFTANFGSGGFYDIGLFGCQQCDTENIEHIRLHCGKNSGSHEHTIEFNREVFR